MNVPPSLATPELVELWTAVQRRLENLGIDNRGRVATPQLSSRARHVLSSILDRKVGATIDLGLLEQALVERGVGDDLAAAMETLGFPIDPQPAARRASRRLLQDARTAAREAAALWPEEWAPEWIDEVIRAGVLRDLETERALQLVGSVRRVLDRLDRSRAADEAPISRVDLAATTLGSSHALDTGSRLETATTRALARVLGQDVPGDIWERAGAHSDLVSAPVLTWGLPVDEASPLFALVVAAHHSAVPLHLTQFAMRRHQVTVPPGSIVHAFENPRIVEAAAQRRSRLAVICTNGNPSGAVRLLVGHLLAAGATVRYHGDFDAAGLAICARMVDLGMVPWSMGSDDYRAALAEAEQAGIDLPVDEREAGATRWDPLLQRAFNSDRRIVHEERLIDRLLAE